MDDSYRTIAAEVQAGIRELGSRFTAFAYPVDTVDEALKQVEKLRRKYHDAAHHCYAYRIGLDGITWRANDDGEPNGSAGLPILNALRSAELTNILVVVVRYFGGTKLGIPGLINAYTSSTVAAIEASQIIDKQIYTNIRIEFDYTSTNDVMKVIKAMQPLVISQTLDNRCVMQLAIRQSLAEKLLNAVKSCATIIEPQAS